MFFIHCAVHKTNKCYGCVAYIERVIIVLYLIIIMPWAPALIQFNLNQMCAFGVSVWSVFAGGKKKREQSPNKLIFLTLTVASVLLPSPKSRIFTWQWNWEKKELGSPLCFLGSCLWLQKCIIMNNINLVVSLACFDSSLICKVPWWCSIALCIDKLFSCFIRQAIGSKMEYTKSFYCCVELIKKEVIKYNNVFFFHFSSQCQQWEIAPA